MTSAYYNEIDPFAATWLRELIKAGLIADGEVDERSIVDVQPGDLVGFVQCHFFAGIGGWSYALRLAGWADDRPVWTGSCPCQPFSSAGTQAGGNDPRDLWPAWFQLVKVCRPGVVFGEQVESAIAHGWLDRLCDDMEREGYAVGAAGLPAACVGAPHRRQRLWFVADSEGNRLEEQRVSAEGRQMVAEPSRSCGLRSDACVADPAVIPEREPAEEAHAVSIGREARAVSGRCGEHMADAYCEPSIGAAIARAERDPWRVEPAVGRVAHGVSHKLVEPALKGYGNAIVPQVAAAFIEAYCEGVTA
jgi:DNA (cytosine-5)-methyltransferase 1